MGMLGSSIQLGSSVLNNLNESTPDASWSGITTKGTAGAALALGDLVYLAVADNKWEKTDADAEATAGPVLLGIATATIAEDAEGTLLLKGFINDTTSYNFTTAGAPLYVSTTTGEMTQTAPSGQDDIIRVVGYAHDDADTIYFDPSNDYLEVLA
tara:strand:- start:8705 stop:9169 length:465 start_codon:yes stop_codon:yes gene_type:complete